MTAEQHIEKITRVKTVECSCNTCVNMCKTAPCLGTPSEMNKLISNGYNDKLRATTIALPQLKEWFGVNEMRLVAIAFDESKGQCVMLDENNKCMLHENGLKPSEGKFADCKRTEPLKHPVVKIVLAQWISWQKELYSE